MHHLTTNRKNRIILTIILPKMFNYKCYNMKQRQDPIESVVEVRNIAENSSYISGVTALLSNNPSSQYGDLIGLPSNDSPK
ncbi:hypothetical protein PROFUN_05763 [Planoprotostelium fungivorum]|uniref:Uncharacterized protein n=1 Tax=Planoprotostelium fungivorum TaxID=1890364 RepID=A0A2P6NPW4_9EUKA|nr:hypothetical protein PROFUN_05763 [Planoprotostelium fungivorum]